MGCWGGWYERGLVVDTFTSSFCKRLLLIMVAIFVFVPEPEAGLL